MPQPVADREPELCERSEAEVIGPKTPRPSPADEKRAYADATTRDNATCVRCGAFGIERDHRQNRQAGNTVVSNLQGLCRKCHQWKTENPTAALLEGFAVPRWARPETWPAWRVGVGWVLYFDTPDQDGNWWQEITEAVADMLMRGGG